MELLRSLGGILMVAAIASLTISCGTSRQDVPQATNPANQILYRLSTSITGQQPRYAAEVNRARERVQSFFGSHGFSIDLESLTTSVMVLDWDPEGLLMLEQSLGVGPEDLPETFSGTVVDDTLYLVTIDRYRTIWDRLYSDWPWRDESYRQLMAHELAHKAHETIAITQLGSADGMGPVWFFEGLAVMCAGQFDTGERPMTLEEILTHVGTDKAPAVSYPLYGRLVRSLSHHYPMSVLILRASDPAFPQNLSAED